jgi:adenylate kinase
MPPKKAGVCDECKSELFQRDDDWPEAIRVRMAAYQKGTVPLEDFYREKGCWFLSKPMQRQWGHSSEL